MNKKIGIFDSGIGGITTYKEILKLLPNEEYIYYADVKNNPYGEKTQEELHDINSKIVDYLISRDVKLIVIACNTATTNSIEYLRSKYKDINFVGTEPAIKVACDKFYKNILVLATLCTISSEKTKLLVSRNKKKDQSIYLQACNGLANAIENHNDKLIDELLNKYLSKYKDIDAIVLGCTHYLYIKDKLTNYFPNAKIIDGNYGVAKRVKYILETNNLLNTNNNKKIIDFITSK